MAMKMVTDLEHSRILRSIGYVFVGRTGEKALAS